MKNLTTVLFLVSIVYTSHAGQHHASKIEKSAEKIMALRQRDDSLGRRAYQAFVLDEDKSQRTKQFLCELDLTDKEGKMTPIARQAYGMFGIPNRSAKNQYPLKKSCVSSMRLQYNNTRPYTSRKK